MRNNTPAKELMNDYSPEEIGKRIFELIGESNMTLKDFETVLEKVTIPPFGNLERFIPARSIRAYDKEKRLSDDLYRAMGLFFLDFAFTAYYIALILRTDPVYLAFGKVGRAGKTYEVIPYTTEDGVKTENSIEDQASRLQPIAVGERIRDTRNTEKKSTRAVAQAIKVSLVTYLLYEKGNSLEPQRFSFPVFFKLCDELNVEPDYIMLDGPIYTAYQPGSSDVAVMLGYNSYRTYRNPQYYHMDELYEEYMQKIAEQEAYEDYKKNMKEIFGDTPFTPGMDIRVQLKKKNGQERADFLKTTLLQIIRDGIRNISADKSIRELTESMEQIRQSIDTWTAEDIIVIREMADGWLRSRGSIKMEDLSFCPPDYNNIPAKNVFEAAEWLKENLANLPVYSIGMIEQILL